MFDDITTSAVHTALSGLSLRQRVIADNVANSDTPSFLAGQVNFESALRAALAGGGNPASVRPSVTRSMEPPGVNGNNVNLDEQTLSNEETGLSYQLMLNALDAKFSLLHDAIGG